MEGYVQLGVGRQWLLSSWAVVPGLFLFVAGCMSLTSVLGPVVEVHK